MADSSDLRLRAEAQSARKNSREIRLRRHRYDDSRGPTQNAPALRHTVQGVPTSGPASSRRDYGTTRRNERLRRNSHTDGRKQVEAGEPEKPGRDRLLHDRRIASL